MRLKNKVVIVTASTRGIGYAIVKACAKEGAIVYMAARNKDLALEKIKPLLDTNVNIHFVYNDATKKETYQSMIKEVIQNEGRVDILVNNFGISNPQKDLDIESMKYDDFINTVDINLASVFLSSQAVIPYMKKQESGSIINISSIGGLIPDIARIGYAVSKDAIIYLSKNMALQLARNKIRVNVVCPGQTATDAVMNNMSKDFQDFFLRHTPIQRMAEPEEIANAVVYFASDESSYTTGQVLAVSGGFGLGTPVFADLNDLDVSKRH
ncbi:MAG: SDR family oxidoreductase [Coprobacillus sp.]